MRNKRQGIGRYRSQPLGPGGGPDKLGMWEEDDENPGGSTPSEPPKFHIPFDYEGSRRKDPGLFRSLIFYLYVGTLLTVAAVVFFAIGYGWPYLLHHIDQLPDIELVNDYRPDLGSQLLDIKGEPIAQFFNEDKRRLRLVRYEDIPPRLVEALVATEDQLFFSHHGINPVRIGQSFVENQLTGSMKGGSTVTQQLAKDLFTDQAKTYQRKIQEALYALKIEQALSKEEILTIYLNQVDFGHNTTGLLAAAEYYFGKHPTELDLAECATLVGILKANTRYSPKINPKRSKDRRGVVLNSMREMGFITEDERIQAASEELVLKSGSTKPAPQLDKYPYWDQFVRDNVLLSSDRPDQVKLTSDLVRLDRDALETGGHRIKTTLDPQLQEWGTRSLQAVLIEQERIQRKSRPASGAFSGTIKTGATLLGKITGFEEPHWLTVKLVDVPGEPVVAVPHPGERDWREVFGVLAANYYVPLRARERAGEEATGEVRIPEIDLISRGLVSKQDLRFALQDPFTDQHAEGALVTLEVGTGRILAWVGGYDWYLEASAVRRNRVVEPLQPGSSFKPIIYAAAFENGYSPSTPVSNASFSKWLPNGQLWQPMNYDKESLGGTYSIRRALIKSLNVPTVRVFETLVGNAYSYDPFYGRANLEIAKRMGIKQLIPKDLSVALGTATLTPLEMATAYSVFANNGILIEPYAVEWVETRDGEKMYIHRPAGKENAIDPVHCYLMTDILSDVIRTSEGTGYRYGGKNFPYPIAGKTGTTNDYFDAWFVGYSKTLVTALWIGHDRWATLGSKRSGGAVALPPWLDYMRQAIPYHLHESQGIAIEDIPSVTDKAKLDQSILAFNRPTEGLREIEVCVYSGARPNAYCRTRKSWFLTSDVPKGFCTDCGVQYKDVPVASDVVAQPVYPSQSSLPGPAAAPQRPRAVRRLEPLPAESPRNPQVGPQFEIENARELDMSAPVPLWDTPTDVQPAVPRPIPEGPPRQQ